jgi:transketolase
VITTPNPLLNKEGVGGGGITCYNFSMSLTDTQIKNLEQQATAIRASIIEMLVSAGSGHTAGPLGMTDIFTVLYFHIANHDPKNPEWANRDRIILSNGHIAPVRYATMAHAGYFPVDELLTLRKFKSRLQGHPERHVLPGLENTSGPLGSGLSQAIGMALGLRMDTNPSPTLPQGKGAEHPLSFGKGAGGIGFPKPRVYCLMSDGELNEGNSWEAIMFAGKEKLGNLTAIIDRNNIQIDGDTEDVMPLEPLADKWKAFNWHVIEIDGHNFQDIVDAVNLAKAVPEKPTVIIARTIPGKGITEIEGDYKWHGVPPNEEQAAVWLKELRTLSGKIDASHNG